MIKYKYLINTIPLNNFLKLLKKYDNVVRKMSYNKVLVFNLGFNKPSLLCTNEHWLYIPSKDINFYSCGFYNKILGTKNLSMYIEIGYGKNQEISKEEIDKQLKLTLKGLKEIGIINDDINLKEYASIIMDPAYVHITKETNLLLDKVKKELNNNGIYTIGRYGAWTYNSMEDCMVTAKELAQKLNGV